MSRGDRKWVLSERWQFVWRMLWCRGGWCNRKPERKQRDKARKMRLWDSWEKLLTYKMAEEDILNISFLGPER